MLDETPAYSHSINRRQSSFNLSNLADVPKQLTTTLAKPISSFHSQTTKHIHSPNDVVNKLLQSFNLQNPPKVNIQSEKAGAGGEGYPHCRQFFIIFSFIQFTKHKPQRHSPSYTYQESQQHKAKLITNLLSSNSIENFPYFVHQNNVYH